MRLVNEMLEDRIVPQATSFADNYVTQVYTDLLHRAVDPGGLASWSGMVTAGVPLNQIIMDIESSQEYRDDEVNQMYETFLNRPADPGAMNAWSVLLQNATPEQVEADIIGSPEFFQDAGGSDQGFLNLLYRDALGRAVDPSGEAGFGGELGSGVSPTTVAYQVLMSNEYRGDLVASYYEQFLHRAPAPDELSAWVSVMDQGITDQEAIAGFLSSPEYQSHIPAPPVVTTPSGPVSTQATSFTIGGTAESGSLIQISSNGSLVGSEQLVGGQTDFSITVPLAANTVNNFVATATNAFGEVSPQTDVPAITATTTSSIVKVTAPTEQKDHEGDAVTGVDVTATDTEDKTLKYSAENLPAGLSINSSTGVISGTISTGDSTNSPYTVTVSASDGVNSDSATFTWLVDSGTNPTVTAPANQTDTEDQAVTGVTVTATEGNKNPLVYSAANLPEGLSINGTTGVISGTIADGAAANSPYTVTVSATDGLNTGSSTFTWTVKPVLAVTAPAAQTNVEGQTVSSVAVTATDSQGNTITSYSAKNLPNGLTINSGTGVISGTIDAGDSTSSPYTVTVTVTDSSNITGTATFTWTVNTAVTVTVPSAQTDLAGDTVSGVAVTATDSLSNPIVSYTAQNLPSGLSIDSSTGVISGTIQAGDASSTPYTVKVTATDSANFTGTATFSWTVNPVVTVTPPAAQTNFEGDDITGVDVAATDLDSNSIASYSASNLPNGLTINSSTGVISGTIAAGDASGSPYAVTVTATDSSGFTGSSSFTWTVNPIVSVTPPSTQNSTEGGAVSGVDVTATDHNSKSITIYSATNLPNGLTINSSTGVISGTIQAGDATSSPYTVTVTATDSDSFSGRASFTWDVAPAVAITSPGEQKNHVNDSVDLTVHATDAASKALTFTASNLPSGLTMSTAGVISGTIATGDAADSPYTVTVTVSDGTNTSTSKFTWLVDTTTNPVVTAPATQQNMNGDTVTGVVVGATESNTNPLTYSATNLPPGLTINSGTGAISGTISSTDSANSPYSVTVSATDGLNTGSATFSWVVTTNATSNTALPFSLTNPAWVTLPSGVRIWDVTVGTGATAAAGSNVTVTYTGYYTDGGIFNGTTTGFQTTLNTTSLIAGWVDGIPGMKVGGERRLDIPSSLAYGVLGKGTIPPNTELVFDITLTAVS